MMFSKLWMFRFSRSSRRAWLWSQGSWMHSPFCWRESFLFLILIHSTHLGNGRSWRYHRTTSCDGGRRRHHRNTSSEDTDPGTRHVSECYDPSCREDPKTINLVRIELSLLRDFIWNEVEKEFLSCGWFAEKSLTLKLFLRTKTSWSLNWGIVYQQIIMQQWHVNIFLNSYCIWLGSVA